MNGPAGMAAVDVERPRHGLFRRRKSNRRAQVQKRAPLVAVADGLVAVGRGLWVLLLVVGKVAAAVALVVGLVWGTRWATRHVIDSPRFAVHEIQVSPTARLTRDEVLSLSGVRAGDRLLAVDTDQVAAQVAAHPWVATVRVGRQLPSTLTIDVAERRAAAVVALGGLYVVDDTGRPFKRASMAEADGLMVITGVDRAQYVDMRDASEAALREALALAVEYRSRPTRPAPSEINIDMRFGFTLFLLDGGGEIRLGRGEYNKKLARLDQIFEAVRTGGSSDVRDIRLVHLDVASGDKVPVRLANARSASNDPPGKPGKD